MARTLKAIVNNIGESGHPCLVPDISGDVFNFSPLRMMLAVGLSYVFYYFEVGSLYFPLSREFLSKIILNIVKSLLCIYWGDHMVFILLFVDVVHRIHRFVNIGESLHSWDKSHLIMFYDLFTSIFVEDFCIYVHRWYWSVIFFFSGICLVLVSGWWWPQRMCLGVFLPLLFFERVSEK